MSDQPETLAAILAEMRKSAKDSYAEKTAKRLEDHEATGTRDALDIKDAIQCLRDDDKYLLDLADRIEAAVERDEDRRRDEVLSLQRTIVKMQDAIARQADAVNAAELREALEQALAYCESDQKSGIAYSDNDVLVPMLRAALAAPARNCDRFATAEEAMEEWNKYPQSRYKGCRVCPHGDASMVSPAHLTLAAWLFVTAEGGDHA